MKPIKIGKDNILNTYPNIKAPLNQINIVSIPFNIHKYKKNMFIRANLLEPFFDSQKFD